MAEYLKDPEANTREIKSTFNRSPKEKDAFAMTSGGFSTMRENMIGQNQIKSAHQTMNQFYSPSSNR